MIGFFTTFDTVNFKQFEQKSKKMKKIILSVSMALMSTVAFSQIESGTMFLGGTIGFSSGSAERTIGGTTDDLGSTSRFQLKPSFGYMLTDNIGAGLRVGIDNMTDTEFEGADGLEVEDTENLTTIGLFGRYYLPVAGDKLFFHADLGFDIGFGTNTDESVQPVGTPPEEQVVSSETDVSTFDIGLTPGFDYFIGDKWAIEMNWGFLGYGSRTETFGDPETEVSSSGFNLNVDFTQFGVGARWYF